MNRRNLVKIMLDALMLLTLVLMYNKRVISLSFHEIGGLALIGVFLVHVLLNRRWVAKVTAGLKTMKTATRVCWTVDALLLLSFVMIGVSGAMISKKVFSIQAGGSWKVLHYFCAALSVVLMGVHLGLHADFIRSMARRMLRLPQKAARVLSLTLTAALLVYGAYSLYATSFARWISAPFASAEGGEGHGGEMMNGAPNGLTADALPDASGLTDSALPDASGLTADALPDASGLTDGASTDASGAPEAIAALGNAASDGAMPAAAEGRGVWSGAQQESGVDALNVLNVIAQFFSEMFVFACATALLVKGTKRRKRFKPAMAQG